MLASASGDWQGNSKVRFLARFTGGKASAFPFDVLLTGMVGAGLALEALCTYLALARETLFAHLVRLGLPTPPDTALRKPSARNWTIEDIRRLIAWRSSGVHPEVIGQHLTRTRSANAVRAKARRLGLPVPARKHLFRPPPEQLSLALPVGDTARDQRARRADGRRSRFRAPERSRFCA